MMDLSTAWYILPLAVALDLAFGDPPWLPHPIRLMGLAVDRFEPVFRRLPVTLGVSGLLFAVCLVALSWFAAWALAAAAEWCHPLLGVVLQIVLIYTCLAGKCLFDEAMKVSDLLVSGDLEGARRQVGMLVSRDVASLDESGVTRATVETVAENFVDGVLSPMFYAALFGAPGAVAFKMASTLDSMVGYRNETYERFGKASARIDDILNWVPARVSIPVIALAAQLLGGRGVQALKTALRDGRKHKSPNAGRPEAAFAGALQVKINGPGIYHGKFYEKPWIGAAFKPPKPIDIRRAAGLMIISMLAVLPLMVFLQVFV